MQLRRYYLAEEPQFAMLMDQYEKEKEARQKHQLKQFSCAAEWVPKCAPPLSDDQRIMCSGPSNNATKIRHYVYKDYHNRLITISSSESDSDTSYCCSSYVANLQVTPISVGRIVTLFEHTFISTSTFAYISWFDGPYRDAETNLLYAFASSLTQSVMPVKLLSKPLVIAYDDEEIDKIWFLNI